MILIIVSLLLFLGIAFFQAIQGTFSAIITFVLTVLSAAIAANYYGPLSQSLLIAHIPDYADAVSLAAIFFITLMILRTLFDHFIRSNVLVYSWLDRVTAGIASIPTALIIVGMASISFEMLPFGNEAMMFERFEKRGDTFVAKGVFPFADSFTAGLLNKLSSGSLQNDTEFGMAHPKWNEEVSANRIGVQTESVHAVPADSVQVEQSFKIDSPLMVREYTFKQSYRSNTISMKVVDKRYPRDGYYYLAVQMKLSNSAADGDGYYRFGWGQVRLVGFDGALRKTPMNIYAIGVRDLDLPAEFNYMRITMPKMPEKTQSDEAIEPEMRNYGMISKTNTFDVVFEVPEDFKPWFLEFKRGGRAKVPEPAKDDSPQASASWEETTQNTTVDNEPVKTGSRSLVKKKTTRGGWHSMLQVIEKGTAFTNEFPFDVKQSKIKGSDIEIQGSEFASGRIYGVIGGGSDSLDVGTGGWVESFSVPDDKRMLRLECEISQAKSSFLNNIFSSVQGVSQKKAIASGGSVYLPVGKYVILDDGDEKRVELIYNPEVEMTGHLGAFQQVRANQLRGKSGRVGFLYLVPPGTEMDRFEVGGTPIEAQSLELVAPN